MKIFIRGVVAALAVSLLGLVPAEAQLTAVNPVCTASVLTPGPNGSPACSGAWAGNNVNQEADVLQSIFDTWGVTASYQGTTDSGMSNGPFSNVDGTANGSVTFNAPLSGTFILALKASNQFSLFFFDNAVGIGTIQYNTAGVSVNKKGKAQGLSHASLYVAQPTSVPEPTTIFLLGSGLLALMGLAWRRREEFLV